MTLFEIFNQLPLFQQFRSAYTFIRFSNKHFRFTARMNPTAGRSNRSIRRIQLSNLNAQPRRATLDGITRFFAPPIPRGRDAGRYTIAIVGFFDPAETNELETLELETRASWWLRGRRAERSRGTKSQVPSRRRNVTQRRDRFLPGTL